MKIIRFMRGNLPNLPHLLKPQSEPGSWVPYLTKSRKIRKIQFWMVGKLIHFCDSNKINWKSDKNPILSKPLARRL